MITLSTLLLLVAAVFAVLTLFETNGRSWLAWAVLLVIAALLLGHVVISG